MIRMGLATALLSFIATIECSDATAVPRETLLVSIASTTVVASRSVGGAVVWGRIPVDVTLRNPTTSTIQLLSCGPTAERETPVGWQIALEPICSLVGPGFVEIPPSSDRTETLQIAGALSGPGGPVFLGGMLAGRYRLLYRYGAGDTRILYEARSAPFDVTE